MKITQTHSADDIGEALLPYAKNLYGFHPVVWINTEGNIALTDGSGSFSLYEFEKEGIYTGHMFFAPETRGKEALAVGRQMLEEIFTNYHCKLIRGLSPLEKLGARWMSRRLGFTGYGTVPTKTGPCELFILTEPEWRSRK